MLLQGAAYVDGENSGLLKQRLAEHDRRQEDMERTDECEDDGMDMQADENGLYVAAARRGWNSWLTVNVQKPPAIGRVADWTGRARVYRACSSDQEQVKQKAKSHRILFNGTASGYLLLSFPSHSGSLPTAPAALL